MESPPICPTPLVLGKQTIAYQELQRDLPISLQRTQRSQVWRFLVWDGASHFLDGLGSHQESSDHRPRSLHRFWSVTPLSRLLQPFQSKRLGFFPAAMQKKGLNTFGIVDMKGEDWKKTKRFVWLCYPMIVELDAPRLVTPPFSLPRLKKTVPAMNECAKKVIIPLSNDIIFSMIPSSWLVISTHKNTRRWLTDFISPRNISSAALPQSGLDLKLIVLEKRSQVLRKILSKLWVVLLWQTSAATSRKIFDVKRILLGELFPNVAAAFNVVMVEPKFEKEIQSS